MIEHMEEKLWSRFWHNSCLPDTPKRRYCDYYFDRLRWKGFRGVRDIDRRDRMFWRPHMETQFFGSNWALWRKLTQVKMWRYYNFMDARFPWKQHSSHRRGSWHI